MTPKQQDGKVVIFLDIDGVLLPFNSSNQSSCGSLFPDRVLEIFSSILEAVPEAEIVLSSTWRAQQSMVRDILDSFRAYSYTFGGPLEKVTEFYDLVDPNYHSERQYEIHSWLKKHGDTLRAWVALDDEELLEGKSNAKLRHIFEGHAVLTDSHTGLTQENADQAIELLRRQMN